MPCQTPKQTNARAVTAEIYMKKVQLTIAAAQVLRGVIDQGHSLARAVEDLGDSFNGNLSELKEITFGGCRFYIYLDGLISELLHKPIKEKDRIVHFLLVSAIYRIEFMRAPDYAVVNESVSALEKTNQSWAKNLANGVLRNFLRNKPEIIGLLNKAHVQDAFPKHLHERITSDWPEHAQAIFRASNKKPPLTLRINQKTTTRSLYEETLKGQGMDYALTQDSDIGVTLSNPVSVERIPGFTDGRVSVQDESAQIIASAVALSSGQRVLDGCAAPGGKTCLMLESQPDLASLVAIDLPRRITAIEQNLARLKLNAMVIPADLLDTAAWWDGQRFDRIVLDAPCSGSGVICRHPDIKHRRRPSDIEKFAEQQLAMINSVWPLLKPGGKLVYITCSIFKAENDHVIEKFIKDKEDFELQSLNEIFGVESSFGRQRLPGVHSGDGFYYCVINKTPGNKTPGTHS